MIKQVRAVLWAALLLTAPCAPAQAVAEPGRVALENWSYAKSAANQSPWKEWVEQEGTRWVNWMSSPRDDPLWQAGWAHDFIDPKTGAFIPWTPSTDCLRHGAVNGKMFSACLMMQRTYNIKSMLSAARLGRLNGDNRYLDWAASQLDLYRQVYLSHPDRRRGALFVQLLDEATVTTALTESVRLLRPYVDKARADAWCRDLLTPMGSAMLGARQQLSNITAWYNVAAAMVAMECDEPTLLQEALDNPAVGLFKLLDTGLSSDGFWYELSPQYQAYVTEALAELLVSASLHAQVARVQAVWPRLQAMLRAPEALALDNGEGPMINDMNKVVTFPDTLLLLNARRVVTSTLGLQAAARVLDWPQLLDPPSPPDPDTTARAPATSQSTSQWVNGARTLVLRQNGWAAFLRGGQLAPFHAHQDTLSIELKYDDTWLFRNSVTPGYGSELQRNFYKLAAAVSTPMVDGHGVSNWFRPLAGYRADPSLISAKLTSFAKDVTVDRALSVEPAGGLRDTVTFTTTQDTPRVFSQLFHSDCVLPDYPEQSGSAAIQKVSPYLLNWETLEQRRSEWTLRMDCGSKTFMTTITGSRPFSVWRANGPALGPARRRMALLVELESGATGSLTVTHQAPGAMPAPPLTQSPLQNPTHAD